jgi:hypothetical protein
MLSDFARNRHRSVRRKDARRDSFRVLSLRARKRALSHTIEVRGVQSSASFSGLRASGSLADVQPGRAANVGGDPWRPQVPGHRGKADGSNEQGRRARSFWLRSTAAHTRGARLRTGIFGLGIFGSPGLVRKCADGLSSSTGVFHGGGQLQRRLACLQRGRCGTSFTPVQPKKRLEDR